MKPKIVLVCIVAAISLCLFACSPAPEQVSLEVSCDDFGQEQNITRQVEVTAGGSLMVTLCSNATTGYQWSETAVIGDNTVVQQTSHKFESPESDLVGAPGQEVWTFNALKKGTSTISMVYSQPWEGGEEASWTFDATVNVK